MLRIILADIKSMLKRPLLFIVMFLGIAAGTFALTVYWLSASNSQYLSKNWASQDKTVEIYNCSIRKQEINDLMTLLTDGSLPDIYYASVISYDSNDYDLIGMYFPEQTKLKSGEMISAEHLGKNCAVVSADLKDGGVSLGDKVKIKGVSYKVIGVIPMV